MQLFDKEIDAVLDCISNLDQRILPIQQDVLISVKNNMIFTNETAFELGGPFHKSLSYELTTTSNKFSEDKIILIGKDLNEIKEDTDFIRITLCVMKDENLEGEKLYQCLEKIKLTKYRVSPEGYMLRTAIGNQEKVRVSKEFIQKHTFSEIGSTYMHAYKQLPYIQHVQEIFITGNTSIYEQLKEIGIEKKKITDTIDHILKGVMVNDCGSCSVKELCDKVQDLREFHENVNKN